MPAFAALEVLKEDATGHAAPIEIEADGIKVRLAAQTSVNRIAEIAAAPAPRPVIVPSQVVKIVIATKPVDFRKGHDGLAAYFEKELGLKAHSGIVVVFRAKRADRIKILVWDGSGFVLTYKRLEAGKFAWPAINDGVMRLSKAQIEAIYQPALTMTHWPIGVIRRS